MPTAKENLDRYDREIDWQKLVDMAMQDPPIPWELCAWLGHYCRDFVAAYGGWPVLDSDDYPGPVRAFLETLALLNEKGRPCADERHLVKVRQAWTHAVFRDGYEMNLEVAQIAKETGAKYNGNFLSDKRGETPSEVVIEGISKSTKFGADRVKQIILTRKK